MGHPKPTEAGAPEGTVSGPFNTDEAYRMSRESDMSADLEGEPLPVIWAVEAHKEISRQDQSQYMGDE